MLKFENMNRKQLLVAVITVAIVIVAIIGASFAFFFGRIGPGAMTLANVKTYGDGGLVFTPGNAINISGSDWSFSNTLGSGASGAKESYSTTTTVAYTGGDSTTATYNGFLIIGQNTFEYTSGTSPEIIIHIAKDGVELTSITKKMSNGTGSAVTADGTLNAFDFTNKTGVFQFATDQSIASGATPHSWAVTVEPLNVGGQTNNQNANANAKMVGSLYFTSASELSVNEVLMASMGGADTPQDINDLAFDPFDSAEMEEEPLLREVATMPCNFKTNEYVTYADDYNHGDMANLAENVFNFSNVHTVLYSSGYASLVGKYVVPNSSSSSAAQVMQGSTAYKVTSATEAGATCASYQLVRVDSVITTDSIKNRNMVITDDGYYVYRGAVSYNWLKFNNKIYRIIRINPDGSITLMYSGTASEYTAALGSETLDDSARIHGWHFSPGTTYYATSSSSTTYANSLLKTAVENWCASEDSICSTSSAAIVNTTFFYKGASSRYSQQTQTYTARVGVLSYIDWEYAGYSGNFHRHTYLSIPNAAYWLMPSSSGTKYCRFGYPQGTCSTIYSSTGTSSTDFYPVISIAKDLVFVGGSGQIDDPYLIGSRFVGTEG